MLRLSKFLLFLIIIINPLRAQTTYSVPWGNESWSPGATSENFTNVSGSGVNILITVTGTLLTNQSSYPEITNLDTNSNTSQKSLAIYQDFQNNTTSQQLVTIVFSKYVNNLTLGIFDLDAGTEQGNLYTFDDQIKNIQALNKNGVWTNATSATYGVDVTQLNANTFYGNAANPNNQAGGNLNLDFNGTFNQLSFIYDSGPLAISNPASEAISISELGFTVVPEPPTKILGFSLISLIFLQIALDKKRKRV